MATAAFIKRIDELLADRGLGFVSALIDVALIFLAAWLIVRAVRFVVKRALAARKPAADPTRARRLDTAATLIVSVAKYAVYFLAAAAAVGQLGLTASMTSLLTAAGIGGVVVGIGAQSLVKDVVSGFFLLFEDQFAVGDTVTAGGVTGKVEAIALRTTAIRSYTGEVTIVPNGSITTLTNYSRTGALAVVDMPVSISEDAKKALALMLEEAKAYREEIGERAAGEPEAPGAIRAENGALVLRVTMPVKPLEHWGVQRELTARIAARFQKEGVRTPCERVFVARGEGRGQMIETFALGDRVVMKKPHACGANEWAVTRTGADVKLRCTGCGRVVMLDRLDFLKRAKRNLGPSNERNPSEGNG